MRKPNVENYCHCYDYPCSRYPKFLLLDRVRQLNRQFEAMIV